MCGSPGSDAPVEHRTLSGVSGVGGWFGRGWCPVNRSVIPKSTDAKSLFGNNSLEPVQGGPVKCVGGNVGGNRFPFEKLVSMRLLGSFFAVKWKNTLSVEQKFQKS